MVKKYARQVTPNKKITPHKLRSTYGTTLYKETGDIYLVADVLGHKDVNTTKKHYAAIDAWACLRIYNHLTEGNFNPQESPYRQIDGENTSEN